MKQLRQADMENEKMEARCEYREDEGSASNTAAETKGRKAKENDNMTAEEKGSKAMAGQPHNRSKGRQGKGGKLHGGNKKR